MDNIVSQIYHSKEIFEHEWGPIKAADYHMQVVAAVTEAKYLCIFQDSAPERRCEYVLGMLGRLNFIRYLRFVDSIFIASKFEFMTMKRKNLTKEFYLRTELDIKELAWNPNESGFVVCTKDNELLLYTYNKSGFTLCQKAHVDDAVPVPALVGWGSESTQFKGSKQNQQKNSHVKEDEEIIFEAPPLISWRSNGEQFVINYMKNNKRIIKVFDCTLNALYESREYANLGPAVSFMGVGQSIACFTVEDGTNKIILFEKNCIEKDKFSVPDAKGMIKKLLFHPQENILAVVSENKEDKDTTIGMYFHAHGKWYLKQELYYPESVKVVDIGWVDLQGTIQNTLKFIVFTSCYLEFHTLETIIHRSPHDATVVVIDGKHLEFYMFDSCITPPPHCAARIEHIRPINRIYFSPSHKRVLVVDSHFQTQLFEYSDKAVVSCFKSDDPQFTSIANLQSLTWTDPGAVEIKIECNVDLTVTKEENGFRQTLVGIDCNAGKMGYPHTVSDHQEGAPLFPLARDTVEQSECSVDTLSGSILYEFRLTTNRDFFINGKLASHGVTSYITFDSYLFFTHVENRLYTVRLAELAGLDGEFNLSKMYSRATEQAARIMALSSFMPPQIILNTPRESLEIIRSIMVIIDLVETFLVDDKWLEAISLCRDEQINYNVLIDLNPERFQSNLSEFAIATRSAGLLGAIVNCFNPNENIFETRYKNIFPYTMSTSKSKKAEIIEALVNHLVRTDGLNNFMTIISIQYKHISLVSALKSIKDLFDEDHSQHSEACMEAVRMLLLTEHFSNVLDAAYNFFDTDFLLLVYQCSKEDPRVYEPEITELEKLEPAHKRFVMCVKGHNAASAVKYLLRCDKFEADYVEEFITSNKLEREAYLTSQSFYKHNLLVIKLYARYLSKQGKYMEAGLVYIRATMHEQALEEYRKALDWREVIRLMTLLKYTDQQKEDMFNSIADNLIREKRVNEAVILLEHYNKDYEKTITALVGYKAFRDAICLAETYGMDEKLVEVEQKVNEYLNDIKWRILTNKEQFENYSSRLQVVRHERKMKLELESLGVTDELQAMDTFSLSSGLSTISERSYVESIGSRASSSSSSRTLRRLERKKIDLREGGEYEDIALIRMLHILYTDTFGLGPDVREVCLISSHVDQLLLSNLHQMLNNLQLEMRSAVNEIWPEVFRGNDNVTEPAEIAIIRNREHIDPTFRQPPSNVMNVQWQLDMYF